MKNIFFELRVRHVIIENTKKYNQYQEYKDQMINIEHKSIPFDHLRIFFCNMQLLILSFKCDD